MGWFFGCFRCSSKKNRKHQAPVSPLPKQQQKPSRTSPFRAPLASSSAIPIKAFPARVERNGEDLFSVRQASSSAPVRQTREAYLHDESGIRMPEKQQKPRPWHQLDDLEEELHDLCKQIDKESGDAEKIREQVNFVKSCGSLAKPPPQYTSTRQQPDHQPSDVQQGRWGSRLASVTSPIARTPPEKNFQFEGLKAALCEPTPNIESHGLLSGIPSPGIRSTLTQTTVHRSMQAGVQEGIIHSSKKPDSGVNLISPTELQQKDQSLPGPSHRKAESVSSDNLLGMSSTKPEEAHNCPNQTGRPLCGTEGTGTQCVDAGENESLSMKKRRLAVNANAAQSPHAEKQPAKNNVSRPNPLCQKRLKIAQSGEQGRETKSLLLQSNPVPMHYFKCDSLSPINESSTSDEESENLGIVQKPSNQPQNSYDSSAQTISQSSSLRQSPAFQTKSVTFASTNDNEYSTDELSYSREGKDSVESYSNSTGINYTNEEDLETVSYSPSTDSEETLSDLSPEQCFSPPVSQERKSTMYGSNENSGSIIERQTNKNYSCVSNQPSSTNGGRRKQYVVRYDSEDDRNEDENELFADALSHVSSEFSEREYRTWQHRRTSSTDSVSATMSHLTDDIDTPPKLSEWISTPNINIQGKHSSRMRTKPVSSVLTPVENVFQWKQLKDRDQKQSVNTTEGADASSKVDTPSKVENICEYEAKFLKPTKIGDENENVSRTPPRKDGGQVNTSLSHWGVASCREVAHANVNASLSHWGITTKAEAISVDASLSQWGTIATESEAAIRVDMSLSHWLKTSSKFNEAQKLVGTSSDSSSGGGGVVSPAYEVTQSMKQTERSKPASYPVSERPSFGALGGEFCGNTKQRSPWDGKGTPNSTTKYTEDQRVKWHSTPFEQRLERALDKQDILLQKKLFAEPY